MQRLLERIATGYPESIVIFDAPALLTSAEAPVLASIAGQIVFVVQASHTPQRQCCRHSRSSITATSFSRC